MGTGFSSSGPAPFLGARDSDLLDWAPPSGTRLGHSELGWTPPGQASPSEARLGFLGLAQRFRTRLGSLGPGLALRNEGQPFRIRFSA